ncbi:hypothetical protein GCM10022204_34980 [Microlunatus aurantiacus]|uniref:Cellulose synthase n=2 Tax=Microlunatus aurantiacus TaxID=446786 RepID=A0ABP7E219_9ACTN
MVVPIAAGGRVWQIGRMPVSDVVLLPLCLGLALIGVIVAGVAWRRGSRGRVLQGVGLALAPIALYFTGLLRLVWDAVVALVGWATSIVFTPTMWFGISLLGVCVVLWVVGGLVSRRTAARSSGAVTGSTAPAVGTGRSTTTAPAAKPPATKNATTKSTATKNARGKAPAPEVDPEMAEIEAILKNRGIN